MTGDGCDTFLGISLHEGFELESCLKLRHTRHPVTYRSSERRTKIYPVTPKPSITRHAHRFRVENQLEPVTADFKPSPQDRSSQRSRRFGNFQGHFYDSAFCIAISHLLRQRSVSIDSVR